MSTSVGDMLRYDLIVDLDNLCATYRGNSIDISPNSPFPFRMLACLREAFPSWINKEKLQKRTFIDDAYEESSYYVLRSTLNAALLPHGLALDMPKRRGVRIKILHGFEDPITRSDSMDGVDYPSKIMAYSSWTPAKEKLSKAERTITIVDSFYGEYWELDLCVEQAIQRRQSETPLDCETKKLAISVYMTSPHTNFGAQRKREIKRLAKDGAKCIELLKMPVSPDEIKLYKSDFDNYVSGLRLIADEDEIPIDLNIYEYFTMPSTRMIIVDDKYFFFGWFPLWAHNPKYFCMYLEDTDLHGADRKVLARLRNQVDNFSAISKLVYSNARSDGNVK